MLQNKLYKESNKCDNQRNGQHSMKSHVQQSCFKLEYLFGLNIENRKNGFPMEIKNFKIIYILIIKTEIISI